MTSESPQPASLPTIGLRPEDLDSQERADLGVLLESDPAARDAQRFAEALASTLSTADDAAPAPSPSAADILAMASQRSEDPPASSGTTDGQPRWSPGAWAIAAAVLVGIGVVSLGMWNGSGDATAPDIRPRGDALPDAEVHLEAVADGPDVRPLGDGAVLHDSEAVVFHVTTTRPGRLTLLEHGPGGQTPILAWAGQPGRHPLTDDDGTPLAWTPESSGVRRYVVEWCPEFLTAKRTVPPKCAEERAHFPGVPERVKNSNGRDSVGSSLACEGGPAKSSDGPCELDALELRWEGPR